MDLSALPLSQDGVLTIPNDVRKIPKNVFKNREDITKVILPQSLLTIGKHAFCSCINLEQVVTNCNLRVIEQGAFQNCFKLLTFDIPKTVHTIGRSAFNCCYHLETPIVIPRKVKELADSVFFNW